MPSGRRHSLASRLSPLASRLNWVCIVSVMDRRHQVDSPKSQQHKKKTANRAPRKTPTALGEAPVHDQQGQIKQPDQNGPMHFGIVKVAGAFREFEPERADY